MTCNQPGVRKPGCQPTKAANYQPLESLTWQKQKVNILPKNTVLTSPTREHYWLDPPHIHTLFTRRVNINAVANISNTLSRNTLFLQIICIKFRNNFPPQHHMAFQTRHLNAQFSHIWYNFK